MAAPDNIIWNVRIHVGKLRLKTDTQNM